MGDPKFETVGKVPIQRIEANLSFKRSNIGSWWMDNFGTVGHNCLHVRGQEPPWLSKVARGFDPVQGRFRNYCMSCGVTAPEEVFEFADLRRFGEIWKKAMEVPGELEELL